MRVLFYLIALITVLLSFSCSSGITYDNYENDTYRVLLERKANRIVRFKILNKYTHSELVYTPELVLVLGEVPERSLSVDQNRSDDTLYQCDSTYDVVTDSISIAFALEMSNHRRMDLSIFNSCLQDYTEGEQTLVQQLDMHPSSSYSSGITSENYENDTYRIMLERKVNRIIRFKILNKHTHSELVYTPELILVLGEVPERSLSVDLNRSDDCLYQCDSTYDVVTDSISIAFALEVSNHRRMDLSIFNSQLQDFITGDHTLVQQANN